MPSATPSDPEKSPSPPPQPPTQQTPGPRAAAFIQLYNNALESTLKAVSYESFAACFPQIAERAEVQLRAMHGGMVGRLEGFAKNEFESILQERNVVENLNRLEDIIADAKKRKARSTSSDEDPSSIPIPPHTLPPAPLISAHLAPLHRSQQSQLNAKLQTTQSQNATLIETIRRQRTEIEELIKMAEMVVGDLEDAGGRLGGVGEELAREGREAEEVLSSL